MTTPACPLCGQPPVLTIGAEQAFCGTDDCKVLCWNPTLGPEQITAASFVDLTGLTDQPGQQS